MATSNFTSVSIPYTFVPSWNTTMSSTTTSWIHSSSMSSFSWAPQHQAPSADDYACLTDYVKAVLRPQKGCPCKWCKAEPLERAMATVVARKEKDE